MEVILKKDVENLGFTDDLVEVKNGYGRNFLIPQGFAVLATTSAKKVLAETMRQRAHRNAKLIKDAQKVAKSLEDVIVKIMSKTADGIKLFGSVNNADVSEALVKLGHDIEKRFISIEGRNIKRVGEYIARVRLHRELIVDLPFEIYADPASLHKKQAKKAEVADVEIVKGDSYEDAPKQSIDDVLGLSKPKKVEEVAQEIVAEVSKETPKDSEVKAKKTDKSEE